MMLAGFQTPTQGEIVIDGRPVGNLPHHKRDIGIVFQNYALFLHITVSDNLAFSLEVRKRPRAEISQGRPDLGDYPPRRPRPTPTSRPARSTSSCASICRSKLSTSHAQLGVTFVYVSQDQLEALTRSDRVAVMSK